MKNDNVFEKLDKELKDLNLTFDKGLPILREKLWSIADQYGVEGTDVFSMYMDWKSKQQKGHGV